MCNFMCRYACLIFELLTGDLLFDPDSGDNYDRDEGARAMGECITVFAAAAAAAARARRVCVRVSVSVFCVLGCARACVHAYVC